MSSEQARPREAYPAPSSPAASRVMQANKKRDTKPEVSLRSALHRAGLRFRKDRRVTVPGRRAIAVDIVFPRQRLAVFVDGCFWHQCPEHSNVPRANRSYWEPKLRRNVERDREIDAALVAEGWRVIRIWEHQPLEDSLSRIASELAWR